MAKIREGTLDEFKQDRKNANAGTKKGMEALVQSIQEHVPTVRG